MGKARKIPPRTRVFDKAGDAAAFFKETLNRYQIREQVTAEDAVDLCALLERHDELVEKTDKGIVGFEVNIQPDDIPQFSSRCFWIVRSDGAKIDFSIGHCLEVKPYD